jgi:DNA-binding CsgD family transcriptional regulator
VAAASLGVVHLDAGLRVVEVSDAFCEQLGLPPAGVKGEVLSRFFHPTARESLREHFARLLVGGHGDFSIPMTLVDAHGGETDCMVTGLAFDTTVRIDSTDCAAIALVVPDSVHSTPLILASAPAALTTVPAHILEGVAAGLSTQQLASRLGLSSHGVEYHISVMMRKLKAPNRSALVARAYALDIFMPHCWPPRVKPQYVARFPVGAGSVGAGSVEASSVGAAALGTGSVTPRSAAPPDPGLVPAQRRRAEDRALARAPPTGAPRRQAGRTPRAPVHSCTRPPGPGTGRRMSRARTAGRGTSPWACTRRS